MAGEDPAYTEWLRTQPCAACGKPGPCVPHHRTGAGMGLRAHDHEAVPLHNEPCHLSHLHKWRGPFRSFTREQMRAWHDVQIREHRARYADDPVALPY